MMTDPSVVARIIVDEYRSKHGRDALPHWTTRDAHDYDHPFDIWETAPDNSLLRPEGYGPPEHYQTSDVGDTRGYSDIYVYARKKKAAWNR